MIGEEGGDVRKIERRGGGGLLAATAGAAATVGTTAARHLLHCGEASFVHLGRESRGMRKEDEGGRDE